MKRFFKGLKTFLLVLCVSFLSFNLVACGDGKDKTAYYDITGMSETIATSTVNDMNKNPKDYLNAKVKIKGDYGVNEVGGNTYHIIQLYDSTNCCYVANIEFTLAQGYKYPKEGKLITIEGTLTTYKENGKTYANISSAEIL